MKRHPALVPLSHQHQHALALCVRLRRGQATAEDVRQAFREEIAAHFRAEEGILFPAARAHGVELELVEELLAEHRLMEGQLATLDAGGLADFAELLDGHIRKEERRLFESLQSSLSPSDFASLSTRLNDAPG